jgi:LCP family protein required for cell wall assembly
MEIEQVQEIEPTEKIEPAQEVEPTEKIEPAAGPRPASRGTTRPPRTSRTPAMRWITLGGAVVLALASASVLALTGYAWSTYATLDNGIHKSQVLAGVKPQVNGDTNILIMGLDSRLDENGNPLPADIYNALHAGNQADGGMNSNVLMMLHVPGDGSKATAISIPRDDYVAFPNCPDGQCHGKIKQAYGLAFDQEAKKLAGQGVADSPAREQQQRDAGRTAEIATVQQFLGGVQIDHFVEVTLVAFFQIAQVVQPITVCTLAATQDTFSGAKFGAGPQQLNAEQALAFVRQRRDTGRTDKYFNNFSDLDRERRQQAFIASLAYQLKQAGTFTNPSKISAILDVAKLNTAVDSGLDLLSFAQQASNLTGGNITFYTLPIDHYGKDSIGEDVNYVNLPLIQSTVHSLLTPQSKPGATSSAAPTTTTAPPTTTPSGPPVVVNVVNESGKQGLAGKVETALSGKGFLQGSATSQYPVRHTSVIDYGTGASAAATTLSGMLGGVSSESDSALGANTVRIVLGTDFSLPAALGGTATSTPPPATAVSAANGAAGPNGPPDNALSALSGGSVPCVK